MQHLLRLIAAALIVLLASACNHQTPVSAERAADVQKVLAKKKESAPLTVFQAAGPAGARGVLTEGATFAPTNGGTSKLERDDDELSYKMKTTGLPPGAYTNWWVIINDPSQCAGAVCTLNDVFNTPASRPSVFWSTGGIVKSDGVGKFAAKIREDQPAPGPDGFLLGAGLEDAENADVFLIVKYHGPASSDPNELYLQTNTLLGLCDDRANALPNGQCFDPQIVNHIAGDDGDDEVVSTTSVVPFQPAGSLGGGVLQPGTFFPPTGRDDSRLEREGDELSIEINTSGLPAGAYTAWWIIFNNPAGCFSQCGAADFGNPAARATVFWATGGVVQQDGIGEFEAEIREGQASKGPDGFVIGSGLDDATNAEVHIAIKYHGPASSDPNVLFQQLNTLLGGCGSGANANANGQCFDPQAAVHRN